MTINCDEYRKNIKYIEALLKDTTPQEQYDEIGMLAVVTGVPIIVVACYVGELYGFTPQLVQFIHRLKKFYTMDEILNVRSNDSLLVL